MFGYNGKLSKVEKKEDLAHSKFKGIIFYIEFLLSIFSKIKILPNSQGLDK